MVRRRLSDLDEMHVSCITALDPNRYIGGCEGLCRCAHILAMTLANDIDHKNESRSSNAGLGKRDALVVHKDRVEVCREN